jgi:hypothetical protein
MATTKREPEAVRPQMRGYGVPASMKGAVPWRTAEKRFAKAHNYWVTTVHPDGRPNSSAVWGLWLDGAFWFSCSPTSRKAKNIALNAACTVTTDVADDAVIIEGKAAPIKGRAKLAPFVRAYKRKYDWDMDPASPGYFIVTPRVAFAFTEHADRFASSATKYEFAAAKRRLAR